MAIQYYTISDPQFGDTIVRANGTGEATSFYQSYLKSINATSTGNAPGFGVSQGVQRAPEGAHVIAGADRGDQGMIGFRLGTVSSEQPAGMWANNAQLSDSEYFTQFGYTADGYRIGGQKGPVEVADPPAAGTVNPIKVNAVDVRPPDPDASGFLETADNVAGFLKGLGYDVPASRGGAADDFRYQQGALGVNTFAGQDAADFYRAAQDPNSAIEYNSPFGSVQDFGANVGGFTGIGTSALKNLETLASLGKQARPGFLGGSPGQQAFVNPNSDDELDRGGIQAMLNAAFQGAGVSPLTLGRGGVSQGDVQQLYSQYAANTPGLKVGGNVSSDTNFLDYAAQQYGLSNFFNR